MDHNSDRFQSHPDSREGFDLLVRFLGEECQLLQEEEEEEGEESEEKKRRFSREEIERCVGIVMTNAFENEEEDEAKGRAVYPTLSLLSHSCASNLRHVIKPGRQAALVAQTRIKKGEELTIRYTGLLQGHLGRRSTLLENWFFLCSCPRCRDPTEFGTFASALICKTCNNSDGNNDDDSKQQRGFVLPSTDADVVPLNTDWVCNKCKATTPVDVVRKKEAEWNGKLNSCHDLRDYESLLSNHDRDPVFHPRHVILMLAKRNVYSMKGVGPDDQLDRSVINEKIRFCRQFIRYLSLLDPCEDFSSPMQNVYILELAKLEISLAKIELDKGEVDKDEFARIVRRSLGLEKRVLKGMTSMKFRLTLLDNNCRKD